MDDEEMVTERERKKILESLITFSEPVDQLRAKVRAIPWDAEEPLVAMLNVHAIDAIKRVLSHEIEPAELSSWADLIEMREDIDIEGGQDGPLRQFVYETATPEFYPLTPQFLTLWESELIESAS
jgi:hypothetical protein